MPTLGWYSWCLRFDVAGGASCWEADGESSIRAAGVGDAALSETADSFPMGVVGRGVRCEDERIATREGSELGEEVAPLFSTMLVTAMR